MTRRAVAALAAAAAFPAALPAAAPAADTPRRLTVVAAPGAADRVAAGLSRGALRVLRRTGRRLEVAAPPRRAAALTRVPGVAAVTPSRVPFQDAVESEGLSRSGASRVAQAADGGRGVTIAVMDLGFGAQLAARQRAGELPPDARLTLKAFDPVGGIAGTNAYGNATNHGELVAQTVYDYAPQARYIFVSYHTEADFVAAADWVTQQRPDIVVHSNSFIEGQFDGTGPEAQAVDRAAAAGILWFNSAGNYAQLHWAGPWADADGDGALDLGGGGLFSRAANQPITFAVSWAPTVAGPATDLDIVIERFGDDGVWTEAARSADLQSAGAGPSERIVGYLPTVAGTFRLRVLHAAGEEPAGQITIFSREIPLAPWGGGAVGSVPTPGDAAGAIAVGAVDWRGNALKNYSSQGPTADGRPKPDLVAPTNTRILGPAGSRSVGGTSNAAPNAAGVAAVILAAQRAARVPTSAPALRAVLESTALDLGDAGRDLLYGAGRVRAEVDPPRLALTTPAPGTPVRGRAILRPAIDDESDIARWSVLVDGDPVTDRRPPVGSVGVDTRTLGDGPHVVEVRATDLPGNAGVARFTVEVDNTRPAFALRGFDVVGVTARLRAGQKVPPLPNGAPPRMVRMAFAAFDAGRPPMRLTVSVTGPGYAAGAREVVLRSTDAGRVELGRLPKGRSYRVAVRLADRAGNVTRLTTPLRVR